MHGREARLPVQIELAPDLPTPDLESRVAELQRLKEDYTEASANISKAQQKGDYRSELTLPSSSLTSAPTTYTGRKTCS